MLQKISQIPNQMTLSRMGSRYPSRLSFSRSMLRKFFHEKWQVSNKKLDLDKIKNNMKVFRSKPSLDNSCVFRVWMRNSLYEKKLNNHKDKHK